MTAIDWSRSYKQFVEITVPLLFQHYERIRAKTDSDDGARRILALYSANYQTFDARAANELHDLLAQWLTRELGHNLE